MDSESDTENREVSDDSESEQHEDRIEDVQITRDEAVEDLDQSPRGEGLEISDDDSGSDAEVEDVEELKTRISQLQNELEEKDKRIQELEEQVQELQMENDRLLQELEDQKNTIELE